MALNTHSLDLEASSSQYASITDASQTGLDITGDISIECWVKFESLPGAGSNMTLVAKFLTTGNQRSYRFILDNTAGVYRLKFTHDSTGAASETEQSDAFAPSTGIWYHFAVVWTASTSSATFYIDGVAAGTDAGTQTSMFNSTAAFVIGNHDGATTYLDGLIDEVRIWNDVRTETEIENNMFTDVTGQANLQGYWKLNNGYTDSSGNGNTLTASGSPVFSTDVPFELYTVSNNLLITAEI